MCFYLCKPKAAYEMRIGDWSSDVCSSDLLVDIFDRAQQAAAAVWIEMFACKTQRAAAALLDQFARQRCEAAALPFGCGDQRHDMRIGLADDVMIDVMQSRQTQHRQVGGQGAVDPLLARPIRPGLTAVIACFALHR